MSPLEKSILTLTHLDAPSPAAGRIVEVDGRASLVVTILYLVAVLSVPLTSPVRILWLAVYPIVASMLTGLSFGRLFLRSLCILPLVAVFGVFNPVFDRVEVEVCGIVMSRGWLTFASIIVRGLLAFQALLILISTEGFTGMCRAMERLRVPSVLTTQLMMVYRYLTVLLNEALQMKRAREARGFGRRHLSIREWGPFIGQLFIRTVERSERIHKAMLARGFNGTIPHYHREGGGWRRCDTVWILLWTAGIAFMRFVDIPSLANNLLS